MKPNRLIYLPLGGAGEVGMNAYVYGYGPEDRERLILVDLGVTFPEMETTPGVDLILPDMSWLIARADRIEAIFITHAHEDHIGALAHLWPRLKARVYARRFTATLGRLKFDEYGHPRDAFTVVAFTPDGKQILSVGHDKFLRYWNIADGKEAKKLGPTPDYIFGLAVSKDGKNVAAAGYGGSLRVYEIATGKELYNQHHKGWITYCVAFAPDGKSVVTGHEKSSKGIAKVTSVAK